MQIEIPEELYAKLQVEAALRRGGTPEYVEPREATDPYTSTTRLKVVAHLEETADSLATMLIEQKLDSYVRLQERTIATMNEQAVPL